MITNEVERREIKKNKKKSHNISTRKAKCNASTKEKKKLLSIYWIFLVGEIYRHNELVGVLCIWHNREDN